VRVTTRLQTGERKADGIEWSTGDFDFPANGPADIYALGVPRDTPIKKDVTTATAEVQTIINGINHAHDNFLKNYRALIWSFEPKSGDFSYTIDIIWRDGEKMRQNHHDPAFELRKTHAPPLPQPNPAAILAWAAQSNASVKLLIDSDREYTWRSAAFANSSKPKVHVIRHGEFPMLDQNDWPENIQWPTRHGGPGYQLLEANSETVPGCTGLRRDNGNSRHDYYIDPSNDFVCMKMIWWIKRGDEWYKDREYTLSGLHRVSGQAVAGSFTFHGYGDKRKGISEGTSTKNIEIVPLAESDYPPAIFDPATLTTDAEVEGY
jgi:hypothetical protein